MKKYADGGIYTAEMGPPPQDIDGGSAPRPKKKRESNEGIYTAEMGAPPQDIDGGSAPRPKKTQKPAPKKYAAGGYTKAADGCAQRGKTRGKMV
jgi:hypothetical protein